jgi:hypothetical protein
MLWEFIGITSCPSMPLGRWAQNTLKITSSQSRVAIPAYPQQHAAKLDHHAAPTSLSSRKQNLILVLDYPEKK